MSNCLFLIFFLENTYICVYISYISIEKAEKVLFPCKYYALENVCRINLDEELPERIFELYLHFFLLPASLNTQVLYVQRSSSILYHKSVLESKHCSKLSFLLLFLDNINAFTVARSSLELLL